MNITAIIQLLRPHQYIKNTFVFIGLVFSHQWNSVTILQAIWAFLAFSAVASAVYILNDMIDLEADRAHPSKCMRPLAAGLISLDCAKKMCIGLLLFSLLPSFIFGQFDLAVIIFLYFLMNIAYSLHLKHIVLIDVFVISAGFMLRILAGTIGLKIEPSAWLLLCSMMLTLFLGFSKRTAELMQSDTGDDFKQYTRKVLHEYTSTLLTQLTSITAACTIISYGLYAVAPDTIKMHGTNHLIYTLPFVIYGIFRYLYLTQRHTKGTDTARDLLNDKHLLISAILWICSTWWLLT